ncbi:MAG TPA: hypothetical protein VHR66_21500 [Gemmataceae bacterium]|jgi:hypothetical protein|nr:hypothetical protein [Gemmataceae bacterium]
MSTLGKVLIFFNLLAAGAFGYFTLENWRVRQNLTWVAFQRQVQLDGIPLEAPTSPPADLEEDRVPFIITVNENRYDSVPRAKLNDLMPKGDDIYGGEGVKDQTEEIKRVQGKVFAHITSASAGDAKLRFDWLQAYLLGIVRSGAERDGVKAIFDMRDPSKINAARRDLPLVARTNSQTAALRTLYDIALLGDPQAIMPDEVRATRIAQARESVKRFVLGEVGHGAASGGDKAESERNLTNALVAALQDRAGDAQKQAVIEKAGGDPTGFAHIAAVAVEPLADKASTDRAAAALIAYAVGKSVAGVDTEKAGITAVGALIRPPALNFNLDNEVLKAAENLLNSKFDEAALPAASKTATNDPQGEKARKIAHLLYHIDGWRYRDTAAATARKDWHTRVASIVGLAAYIRAAEAEATEYSEAGQRLIASITEEQSVFEAEYQAQVQRVLFLYSQWLTLDTQLKAQTVITDENTRLMNERKTERDKLLEELAKAQADAKDALEKLKKTQQSLFAIQRDLRDAQEALLILEKELRRIELGPTETTQK